MSDPKPDDQPKAKVKAPHPAGRQPIGPKGGAKASSIATHRGPGSEVGVQPDTKASSVPPVPASGVSPLDEFFADRPGTGGPPPARGRGSSQQGSGKGRGRSSPAATPSGPTGMPGIPTGLETSNTSGKAAAPGESTSEKLLRQDTGAAGVADGQSTRGGVGGSTRGDRCKGSRGHGAPGASRAEE